MLVPEDQCSHAEQALQRRVLSVVRRMCFTLESAAHLRGLEHVLLPIAIEGRALIAELEGFHDV